MIAVIAVCIFKKLVNISEFLCSHFNIEDRRKKATFFSILCFIISRMVKMKLKCKKKKSTVYGDVATNCVKSGLWFHARDFLLCTTKVIHLSCISVYTVFLICISLINGNAEHLFVPVNHPDVFSGENIYLGSCPFL